MFLLSSAQRRSRQATCSSSGDSAFLFLKVTQIPHQREVSCSQLPDAQVKTLLFIENFGPLYHGAQLHLPTQAPKFFNFVPPSLTGPGTSTEPYLQCAWSLSRRARGEGGREQSLAPWQRSVCAAAWGHTRGRSPRCRRTQDGRQGGSVRQGGCAAGTVQVSLGRDSERGGSRSSTYLREERSERSAPASGYRRPISAGAATVPAREAGSGRQLWRRCRDSAGAGRRSRL